MKELNFVNGQGKEKDSWGGSFKMPLDLASLGSFFSPNLTRC